MYTVMLIDDEPLITMGLQKVIEWDRLGLVCAGTFTSARQALQALLEHPVDLLVTDMKMPELSGIDVLRAIRANNIHTKCIILSVHDDFSLIREALPLGIENYLLKPVDIGELNKTLEDAISKIRSEQRQETLLSVGMEAFSSSILNRWLEGRISEEEFWERAALFDFHPRNAGFQAVVLAEDLTGVERSALRAHLQDALPRGNCLSPLFQDTCGRWLFLCAFDEAPSDLTALLPRQRAALSPIADSLFRLPSLLADVTPAPQADAETAQAHPLVRRLEDYLQQHYAENLSLKWMAARMKVSPVYLGKLFSQEKGCTFSEYLKAIRLNEAKLLLDTTALSIAEVAQKTGWRNENYFYTCFRQETGISPRQWQMRGKELG